MVMYCGNCNDSDQKIYYILHIYASFIYLSFAPVSYNYLNSMLSGRYIKNIVNIEIFQQLDRGLDTIDKKDISDISHLSQNNIF